MSQKKMEKYELTRTEDATTKNTPFRREQIEMAYHDPAAWTADPFPPGVTVNTDPREQLPMSKKGLPPYYIGHYFVCLLLWDPSVYICQASVTYEQLRMRELGDVRAPHCNSRAVPPIAQRIFKYCR